MEKVWYTLPRIYNAGGRIMEQERKVEPIGRELVRRLLPRRDPEGHKGTFGKVLCLCGSVVYT